MPSTMTPSAVRVALRGTSRLERCDPQQASTPPILGRLVDEPGA
jgi:hypothetical protein